MTNVLALGLSCSCVLACCTAYAAAGVDVKPSFEALLQQTASEPSDWCDAGGTRTVEDAASVFAAAAREVVDGLNRQPSTGASETVERLRQTSARIDASWPDASRFRGEVTSVPPLVIVTFTFRGRAALYAFGTREHGWAIVEYPDDWTPGGNTSTTVTPAHRGPSNHARFLATIYGSGCGGNTEAVNYQLFEWETTWPGALETLLTIHGVQGFDFVPEKAPADLSSSFPRVGQRRVDGNIITLPYCWGSDIDTWDNPSLCAEDSFDLTGDRVRFRKRIVNRPDLLPIAEAIKHAQAHAFAAVRAYCLSDVIARHLVADFPASVNTDHLRVTRIGPGRERVVFGLNEEYRFEVVRTKTGWLIASFRLDSPPA